MRWRWRLVEVVLAVMTDILIAEPVILTCTVMTVDSSPTQRMEIVAAGLRNIAKGFQETEVRRGDLMKVNEVKRWEEQNEREMQSRISSHKGSESDGALAQSDIVLDKLPKDSYLLSPTSSITGEDAISEAGSMDRSEDSYSNADDLERGLKRYRTQMSVLQLKILKHCYNDYRTPTIHECELLGQEIGLPRRVVQVWFQNCRAKDKKGKSIVTKHFGMIGATGDWP